MTGITNRPSNLNLENCAIDINHTFGRTIKNDSDIRGSVDTVPQKLGQAILRFTTANYQVALITNLKRVGQSMATTFQSLTKPPKKTKSCVLCRSEKWNRSKRGKPDSSVRGFST